MGLAELGRRWGRLQWEEQRETLMALWVALVVELGVKWLPLPTIARLLGVQFEMSETAPAVVAPVHFPHWATVRLRGVGRVLKRWPDATCLRRSLVVSQRLRPLTPKLRIGVRRDGGPLEAHAWVEVGGVSLDSEAAGFGPLSASPTA